MIIKAKVVSLRFEHFEIPEHLKEDYHNEIEVYLLPKEVPNAYNLRRWAKAKGVSLPFADV